MAISSSETPNDSQDVTESQRHRILSSERRRILLDVLAERTTPLDVDTLAKAIENVERDRDTPDPEDIAQIAAGLHHNHLPKLGEAGVVEYDRTANRVTSFQDRISR